MLDYDDGDLIVLAAPLLSGDVLELATSSSSLADKPGDKDNWIERAGPGGRGGGLPPYVRKLARAIMKTGKSKSQAIAIAISRIKKWAAGGDDVNADTRAKAAAALAKWEKLKAKNKAGKVALTAYPDDDGKYLMLTDVKSFNTDQVRRAWDGLQSAHRRARGSEAPYSYSWIRELWTDHIIVENESEGARGATYQKVPYTVERGEVFFGDPVQVEQAWKESEDTAVKLTDELTENESALLADLIGE